MGGERGDQHRVSECAWLGWRSRLSRKLYEWQVLMGPMANSGMSMRIVFSHSFSHPTGSMRHLSRLGIQSVAMKERLTAWAVWLIDP